MTIAGRSLPVPYNGSVARVSFGPRSASRVRRWIREGDFDVLHVHSPVTPSLGMMACWSALGPIVATFHAAIDGRSRLMSSGAWILQATLEKVRARIAVSEEARRTVVEHLGGDAVLVPNGVDVARFADAPVRPEWSGAGTIAFLGRVDESRKGLEVLLDALPAIIADHPEVRLFVAGPGETDALDDLPTEVRDRVQLLGRVSEEEKAELLSSVDLYVAPHIGGESFGIVLLEAMAAGSAVLASDLVAFQDVLDGGRCGAPLPHRGRGGAGRGGVGPAGRPGASGPAGRGRLRAGPGVRLEPGGPPGRRGLRDRRRPRREGARGRPAGPRACSPGGSGGGPETAGSDDARW